MDLFVYLISLFPNKTFLLELSHNVSRIKEVVEAILGNL
jgi:hypothetical protein